MYLHIDIINRIISIMMQLRTYIYIQIYIYIHTYIYIYIHIYIYIGVANNPFVIAFYLFQKSLPKGCCAFVHNLEVYAAPFFESSVLRGPEKSLESHTMSGWWFGTFSIFPYIGLLIIPIDFHIFQRGGPTTNQMLLW